MALLDVPAAAPPRPSGWWRWAAFMQRHRMVVVLAWIAAVGLSIAANILIGNDYRIEVDPDGPAGTAAQQMDAADGESRDSIYVLWSMDGDPDRTLQMIDDLAAIPGVAEVTDVSTPFLGQTAVYLDVPALEAAQPPLDISARVQQALDEGLDVGIAGGASTVASMSKSSGFSEVVGLVAAAIILLLAFGSLVAAAMPLATAVAALGLATGTLAMISHVYAIPPFATALLALLTIGVGIDYALFIVSRHRTGLAQGVTVHDSICRAFDTSGRAVIFAAFAVAICLGAIVFVGIPFLNGVALAAALGVALAALATWTLLPALLSFAGRRVKPSTEGAGAGWKRWSVFVSRHSWASLLVAGAVLIALATPVLSLRLASADASFDTPGTISRNGHELLVLAYGPGGASPITIVSQDPATFESQLEEIAALPQVEMVSPPAIEQDVAWAAVVSKYTAYDQQTDQLIAELGSLGVTPTGYTVIASDLANTLSSRLPVFIAAMLALSSLLLLWVFRSIAIPIKAALMNLLAAGASMGIVVMIFQWGWLGWQAAGPIEPFLPLVFLAILFGLSMDYQVFMVARIREEWMRLGDNDAAVASGLADTGKVVTAAAAIMIAVFGAFALSGQRLISMFGVGLAVAIFIDAFIVRSLMVPSTMNLLGRWNWWIPRWLDRVLPHLDVEGPVDAHRPERASADT